MSADSLDILLVSTGLPCPTSGFGTRVWQLSRYLSARNNVTILTYIRSDETGAIHQAEDACSDLRLIPREERRGLAKRGLQLALAPFPMPYAGFEQRTRSMQAALDHLTATRHFDLVQLESSRLWSLRMPDDLPIVVDEHNIEYELLQRMSKGENSRGRRFFNGLEEIKFRRLEQRAWMGAAGVAVTSDREQVVVANHAPATPTEVVPNAVNAAYFTPVTDGAGPMEAKTIVFAGLMSYRPNIDAAQYLVEEIMPLVRKRIADVKLKIVGGHEHEPEVVSLQGPNVEVTGWVTDVRPFLRSGAVVVAPLRMGSGTRLKVLEALAMGKALVSTSIGCEGIDVRHEDHLLVADEPQPFADQVIRLLSDPQLADRIGAAGREHVARHYSWPGAGARLDALHRRALEQL